jgi:hypothetical protein
VAILQNCFVHSSSCAILQNKENLLQNYNKCDVWDKKIIWKKNEFCELDKIKDN